MYVCMYVWVGATVDYCWCSSKVKNIINKQTELIYKTDCPQHPALADSGWCHCLLLPHLPPSHTIPYFFQVIVAWFVKDERCASSVTCQTLVRPVKDLLVCSDILMTTPRVSDCLCLFKLCIVLSCCEMFVGWLQLLFFPPYPVAYSPCVVLKPGLLEAITLLFAWRQSHASCWVCFISCFRTETTWTQGPWIPYCFIEWWIQLRKRTCVHLLSVQGWSCSFQFILKLAIL